MLPRLWRAVTGQPNPAADDNQSGSSNVVVDLVDSPSPTSPQGAADTVPPALPPSGSSKPNAFAALMAPKAHGSGRAGARGVKRPFGRGRGQPSKRGRFFAAPSGPRREPPPHKRVPGTPFIVDGFHYAWQDGRASAYILTHFHSDHYGGLTSAWDGGTVYCNPVTAALVQQQLRVPASRIREVPMNEPVQVLGCTVVLLDANHCPGAAMWLITTPAQQVYLHVGDFRWHPKMKWHAPLRANAVGAGGRPLDALYLDTTYADAKYIFPAQEAVVAAVVRECKRMAHDPAVLFMFGTYTIGKERLFLAVADALDKRVFVSPSKWRVLQRCGLSKRHLARLTTVESQARIHVVGMGDLAIDKLAQRLATLKEAAASAAKQPRLGTGRNSRFLRANRAVLKGTEASAQEPVEGEEEVALSLGLLTETDGRAGRVSVFDRFHSVMAWKPTGWTFTQGSGGQVASCSDEANVMAALGCGQDEPTLSQGTLSLLSRELSSAAKSPGLLAHVAAGTPPSPGAVPGARSMLRGVAEQRKAATVLLPTGFASGGVRVTAAQRGGGARARHPAWFLGPAVAAGQASGGTQVTQLGIPTTQDTQREADEATPPTQAPPGAPATGGTSRPARVLAGDMSRSRRGGSLPRTVQAAHEFRGGVTLYGVPYSEHSSFRELREAVKWLGARRVVPTVNARNADQARELVQALTGASAQGAVG